MSIHFTPQNTHSPLYAVRLGPGFGFAAPKGWDDSMMERPCTTGVRIQTFGPEILQSLGVEPAEQKIVVVKSSIHYRAAFDPIAGKIIEVDAPGLVSPNLSRFSFQRIRRPLFPLDPL